MRIAPKPRRGYTKEVGSNLVRALGIAAATLSGIGGLRVGRQLHPEDVVADQRTNHATPATAPMRLGDEAHAHAGDHGGVHVFLVRHPVLGGVRGVVERAQTVDLHRAALRHIVRQHTRQVFQHGVSVGPANGGDHRQAVRDLIGRDRLAYRDSYGIPQPIDILLAFL